MFYSKNITGLPIGCEFACVIYSAIDCNLLRGCFSCITAFTIIIVHCEMKSPSGWPPLRLGDEIIFSQAFDCDGHGELGTVSPLELEKVFNTSLPNTWFIFHLAMFIVWPTRPLCSPMSQIQAEQCRKYQTNRKCTCQSFCCEVSQTLVCGTLSVVTSASSLSGWVIIRLRVCSLIPALGHLNQPKILDHVTSVTYVGTQQKKIWGWFDKIIFNELSRTCHMKARLCW